MKTLSAQDTERGLSLMEVVISTALLGTVLYAALSGYVGSMRGSASAVAKLGGMATNARALTHMNMELQEASVREESIEIYPINPNTGLVIPIAVDSTILTPPQTVYPPSALIGPFSFALRFATVGDFTSVGDSIEIEEDGPFLYRLGDGTPSDYPQTHLVRFDESGEEAPVVLCRGVDQVIFQRDSRGGAIVITLISEERDEISGTPIRTRQILTVTPKNDFASNLSNFDMSGETL